MALAPRQERRSPSSVQAEHRTVFRNELTACLTLTAPVGMTEEAKRDWFAVAWDTLKDIEPGILAIGARKARLTCDHPSKIVPAIFEATAEMRQWGRNASEFGPEAARMICHEPDYCTPEEARRILEEYGLKSEMRA